MALLRAVRLRACTLVQWPENATITSCLLYEHQYAEGEAVRTCFHPMVEVLWLLL